MMDQMWAGGSVSPLEKAMIGQYAENQYFGKPSGLMDQCGCSVGGFIGIDFQVQGQPVVTPIQLDFGQSGYCLIITNTGGSHADLTDEYASIPRHMKQVASFFGQEVLRDVSPELFWQKMPDLRGQVSDQALLRAIHFFQDDNRVSQQTAALQAGDIDQFLALVRASGNSSRNQLQNVYASRYVQDQPISLALSLSEHVLAGRGACRVHGGGFAGTIQAFVPLDLADDYLAAMRGLFGEDAPWKMRIRSVGSIELTTP
jgi:galactokinase